MRSMKTLLRLLGAVSLSTVAASSVVACGDKPKDKAKDFDAKVSQNLGLTDADGKGLISPTMNFDDTDKSKVTWEINLNSIKLESLVGSDKKAKDKESFIFLKDVLNIKIDSGTKLEDAIFNDTQIKAATITVSDINVDLKPNEKKNDFYVKNGSYNIMFTNGTTKTAKYKIGTKLGSENDTIGVIGNKGLPVYKTDFNSIFQDEFKVGQSVKNFIVGSDLTSMLDSTKDNIKKIFGIQKLVNSGGTLKLLVTNNSVTTDTFAINDKINVRIKIGEVSIFAGAELTVNP